MREFRCIETLVEPSLTQRAMLSAPRKGLRHFCVSLSWRERPKARLTVWKMRSAVRCYEQCRQSQDSTGARELILGIAFPFLVR